MSTKKVAYLTIDDAPGRDFEKKIDYLARQNVPAIIFCIGNRIEARPDEVVNAIRKGFIIGNHSYSHPHFSDLTIDAGIREISQTDELIDSLYLESGVRRNWKYFRFPFFDVGGNASGEEYEAKWAKPVSEWKNYANDLRRVAFQTHLKSLGYTQPKFEGINLKFFHDSELLRDFDVKCTFDQLEYNLGQPNAPWGLSSAEAILARIDEDFPFEGRSLKSIETSDIVLVHDHDETTELFYRLIDRYLEVGIEFRSIA